MLYTSSGTFDLKNTSGKDIVIFKGSLNLIFLIATLKSKYILFLNLTLGLYNKVYFLSLGLSLKFSV